MDVYAYTRESERTPTASMLQARAPLRARCDFGKVSDPWSSHTILCRTFWNFWGIRSTHILSRVSFPLPLIFDLAAGLRRPDIVTLGKA